MLDDLKGENMPGANMQGESSLKLDDQLCFGLYAATHAMTRAYRPLLNELNLTYSQFLVLMALWERDCQTVSSLGDILFLDSGTLSPVLKRLETAGLVTKLRQRHDERQVEIGLTAQGRALQGSAALVRQKVACRVGMEEKEIRALRRNLDLLLVALKSET